MGLLKSIGKIAKTALGSTNPYGAALAIGGTVAGAAISSKKSKKASKAAAAAIAQAQADNKAAAQQNYDATRADYAPGRALYTAGTSALMRELGLEPPQSQGGGQSGAGRGPDGGPGQPSAAPGGGMDTQAYLRDNPDVAAEAARVGGDPNAFAAQHYEQFGRAEGRAQPMNPSGAYSQSGIQAQPEAQSPTQMAQDLAASNPSPNPFNSSANPRPQAFDSGAYQWQDPGQAPSYAFDFKADPGYEWRQQEAARGGNAAYGARGLLKSGGAIKAAQDRSYNLADQSYNTAFDQYMRRLEGDRAQFNTDRSAKFNIFNTNRGFDYGVSRDAMGDWQDQRNFDYGASRDAVGDWRDQRDFAYGAGRDTRADMVNDRNFAADRADQRFTNLFNLTGLGENAVGGTANARNFATGATIDANTVVGDAGANRAIANYRNNFWTQLAPVAANAAGRALTGGF